MVEKYREYSLMAGMHVIKLKPQDVVDFNLKQGDMIDLSDAIQNKTLSAEQYKMFLKKRSKK